jgi:hypothetical protein
MVIRPVQITPKKGRTIISKKYRQQKNPAGIGSSASPVPPKSYLFKIWK